MSTLYEITGEYLQLLEMLEEADELEEQVIKDTLEGIEGELEIKADGYARIIKEVEAEAKKYEDEMKRLEARCSTLRNRGRILKDHLYSSMKQTGKLKFKTDLFSFGIQKNGGLQPLKIIPDTEIPDEYLKKEPDNSRIREAIKEGKKLPFAVLEERGDHLTIR